jgi:hypothetical protein
VTVLRVTIVVGVAVYALLWVFALNGATSLVGPLTVPLILGVIVALGVALQRFIGLPARKQHFRDRGDDAES